VSPYTHAANAAAGHREASQRLDPGASGGSFSDRENHSYTNIIRIACQAQVKHWASAGLHKGSKHKCRLTPQKPAPNMFAYE
jgi:hypothetical protein